MKASKRPIRSAALLMVLLLLFTFSAYGATTQELIEQTEEEQEVNRSLLTSANERIAALEAQRGNSEAYLNELNNQLSELTDNLSYLEEQHAIKTGELQAVEAELEDAKATADRQYEDMKLRIRYFYESGTATSTLNSLFSASDFMDFLNRAESYAQLSRFDREMLDDYENTILTIEEKEQNIISEKEEIETLKAQLTDQQEQISTVYESAYYEMLECIESLDAAEEEAQALIASIQAKDEELNQLMIRAYEEELAAQEAARREAEERAAAEAAAAAAAQAAAQAAEAAAAQAAQQSQAAYAEEVSYESTPAAPVEEPAPTPEPEASYEAVSMTYLGNFTLTAYCPCAKCCGKWAAANPDQASTASGARAVEGVTVAMGGVPFGTQLSINGHIYTVQDRGTPYGHVDIFFRDHASACAFGQKYADVYMLN